MFGIRSEELLVALQRIVLSEERLSINAQSKSLCGFELKNRSFTKMSSSIKFPNTSYLSMAFLSLASSSCFVASSR